MPDLEIDAEDPDATLCAVCLRPLWQCACQDAPAPATPQEPIVWEEMPRRDRLTILLALARPYFDRLRRRVRRRWVRE